jgi:hypothetical protein
VVQLPPWLTYLIAGLVLVFGAYRIRLFLIPQARYEQLQSRGPMYRLRRRNHLFMGVVFLVLGGWLIANAVGLGPLRR